MGVTVEEKTGSNRKTMEKVIERRKIFSEDNPAPSAPYSPGIQVGDFLFISGQIGFTKERKFAGEDVTAQTKQAMKNVESILRAAGLTLSHLVKMTILLSDIGEFDHANAAYKSCFAGSKAPLPARACYQAAALPFGAKVEIEGVAAVGTIKDIAS